MAVDVPGMPGREATSDLPFGPTSARRSAQYRVKVCEQRGFDDLRIENVDEHGHVQSVVGFRDGAWHTVTLLVDKKTAHVENGRLVADVEDVDESLAVLGGRPLQVENDHFVAPGVPSRRAVSVIGDEPRDR